jgi:hypothetical protein
VTALDVFCARSLDEQTAYRQLPRRDYSDRSGFRNGADEMRGAARATTKPRRVAKQA